VSKGLICYIVKIVKVAEHMGYLNHDLRSLLTGPRRHILGTILDTEPVEGGILPQTIPGSEVHCEDDIWSSSPRPPGQPPGGTTHA